MTDRNKEQTIQEAFEAAFAAKDELSETIIPALVAAMGKEGAADLLRDMADELDEP